MSEVLSKQGTTPFDELIIQLAAERSKLDDNGREMILEAAFRVACADGTIEAEEDQQLRALAGALGISTGVLELEIGRFQRQVSISGMAGS
jgi:tellurite resistance protein